MEKSIIKIGTKVEFIDSRGESYPSVIEVVKESCILVKLFFGERDFPKTTQGNKVELVIYHKGSVYSAQSSFLGIKREKEFAGVVLTTPENTKKIERRKYFRLPINIEIEILMLPLDTEYMEIKDMPKPIFNLLKPTTTIDISGGGMKITFDNKPEVGQKALVVIYIPDQLKLLCSVMRVEMDNKEGKYKVSLKFENIRERDRDKIIAFIFNEMRKHFMR